MNQATDADIFAAISTLSALAEALENTGFDDGAAILREAIAVLRATLNG